MTSAGFRLMAIHAHPDDESSKGAATMLKYTSRGDRVLVVSCTGGERGDILNPKLANDPHVARDVAQVRREEMAAAAAILGVEHTWLGFVDSGLPEGDPVPALPQGCFALEPLETTTHALVHLMRQFRPHVITTYDENGGYPHPDHIMCHRVSEAAFLASGDADRFADAGPAWQPLKMYFHQTFTGERMGAYVTAMDELGLENPFAAWMDREWPASSVTTKVECADYFAQRDQALLAHATQVDPDGPFFVLPIDVQARVWPTEDYEAALSYVPIEPEEDDLFAGLGTPEEADALGVKLAGSSQYAHDGRRTPTVEMFR